ncbi:hypothetical protein [Streptomyces sp. NRRL S-448]|uniref:hypothetical protein n=1 Tax=Streptomyces sp. NRRL S-448 TaxID=1463907 RepID=UPI000AD56BAD
MYKMLKDVDAELIRPNADLDTARDRVAQARAMLHDGLAGAHATVEIEGPEKLARMAEELSRSLPARIAAVHSAALGRSPGGPAAVPESQRIRRFLDHAASKRGQFVEHARNTIDV